MNLMKRFIILGLSLVLFFGGVSIADKILTYQSEDFKDEAVVKVVENKEEIKKEEKLLAPVKDNIGIVRYFYDKDSDSSKQEQSLVLFEGVYRANLGIDYACKNEVFDVYASMSGKVVKVKEDPILGWIVTISHNGISTTYESLSKVSVKVNDKVKQGDKIGKCGENLYEADLKNHLHFMLEKDGQVLDPEKYLNKELSLIK